MNVAVRARQDYGDARNGSELERTVITIETKEPPKTGKTGSVKDAGGQGWFRAMPKILAQLQVGQTYEIEYRQGESARFIDSFMPVEPPAVAQKIRDTVREVNPRPAQRVVREDYDQTTTQSAPPPVTKDEMIFVEGIINRAVQSRVVDPLNEEAMVELVTIQRNVWARTFASE